MITYTALGVVFFLVMSAKIYKRDEKSEYGYDQRMYCKSRNDELGAALLFSFIWPLPATILIGAYISDCLNGRWEVK